MEGLIGSKDPEGRRTALERMAHRQGVTVVPFENLLGDFWPEDESADDFVAFTREQRRDLERPRDRNDGTERR